MRVTLKHVVYTGLFMLAVVSVFILFIGYVSWSPINREAAARIERGMTEKQVEGILGGPCTSNIVLSGSGHKNNALLGAQSMKIWRDERASCAVLFDGDGRVVLGAMFQEMPDPGILTRIRRLFSSP